MYIQAAFVYSDYVYPDHINPETRHSDEKRWEQNFHSLLFIYLFIQTKQMIYIKKNSRLGGA